MDGRSSTESLIARLTGFGLATAAITCLVRALSFPGWNEDVDGLTKPHPHDGDPFMVFMVAGIGVLLGAAYLVSEFARQRREGHLKWWVVLAAVANPAFLIILVVLGFLPNWFPQRSETTDSILNVLWLMTPPLLFWVSMSRWSRHTGHAPSGARSVSLALGFAVLPLIVLSILPNRDRSTLLWREAALGHTRHVGWALRLGADVNRPIDSWYFQTTPLGEAIARGHNETAIFLIQSGADVNKGKPTPIMIARKNGNVVVLELLREKGAKDNAHESTNTQD